MRRVLFLLALFLSSCAVFPPRIEKYFIGKYDFEYSDTLNLLTNGYFKIWKIDTVSYSVYNGRMLTEIDTFTRSFIFLKDELFFIDNAEWVHDRNRFAHFGKTIYERKDKYFYWMLSNGYYEANGDTIKTYFVHKPFYWSDDWRAGELWFVKDSLNNLTLLAEGNLLSNDIYKGPQRIDYPHHVEFFPLDTVTEPDNWLKKEKWFWKEETEFEEWKRKQQLKNKQQH